MGRSAPASRKQAEASPGIRSAGHNVTERTWSFGVRRRVHVLCQLLTSCVTKLLNFSGPHFSSLQYKLLPLFSSQSCLVWTNWIKTLHKDRVGYDLSYLHYLIRTILKTVRIFCFVFGCLLVTKIDSNGFGYLQVSWMDPLFSACGRWSVRCGLSVGSLDSGASLSALTITRKWYRELKF